MLGSAHAGLGDGSHGGTRGQDWNLIADVRNIGRFSPETFEAEWLDGATGPALGARFRGHVKRNEIGPVYWTTCRVTACEPGREFGFQVLLGGDAINTFGVSAGRFALFGAVSRRQFRCYPSSSRFLSL